MKITYVTINTKGFYILGNAGSFVDEIQDAQEAHYDWLDTYEVSLKGIGKEMFAVKNPQKMILHTSKIDYFQEIGDFEVISEKEWEEKEKKYKNDLYNRLDND